MKKKEIIIGLVLAFLMCFSSVGAVTTIGGAEIGSRTSDIGTSAATSTIAATSIASVASSSAQCNDYQDNDNDGSIDYGGGCDCDGDGTLDSFIGKGDSAIIGSFCASATTDESISSYNTQYSASVENECPGIGDLYTSDDECDDENDDSEGLTSEESKFIIELGDDVTEDSIKTATNGDNIVVVYEINNNVYYKLYSSDDGLLAEGSAATCTDGLQQNPAVAMNADGQFTIAWETDADSAYASADGCGSVYLTITVDTTTGIGYVPNVRGGMDIAMKVFDEEGNYFYGLDNELYGEFMVNNHNADSSKTEKNNWWAGLGYDGKASVAMFEDNIVVAWESEDKSDGNYGVYSKMYKINGNSLEKVSAYESCNKENAEYCNGATANEIALFSPMITSHSKSDVDLVAGELNGEEVFVATWRNINSEYSGGISGTTTNLYKPVVRVFSLEDGEPLTGSKNALDESDTLSKAVYPQVELTYGNDNYVVVAWHDNDKKSIDYSAFELGEGNFNPTTGTIDFTLSALGDRETTLISSSGLSGDCHYLQDFVIPKTGSAISSTYEKGMVAVSSYELSSGSCAGTYADAEASNAYLDLFFINEFTDEGDISGEATNIYGSSSSGGVMEIYPRLSASAGDGFYVAYGKDEEISLSKYGFDGKQDALTIGGSASDDSGTPSIAGTLGSLGLDLSLSLGTSTCEFIGCDCDGDGYVEDDYYYTSGYGAQIPSFCQVDPNSGSASAGVALCDDVVGTWYASDASTCALGVQSDVPTASGYCADGIDNDGDGRMDFFGGCDINADNELDWTCQGKPYLTGCYQDCKDSNGRFYLRDAGCLASGDSEYARCSDGIDNDNDGYADAYGGCDNDGDGLIEYHCGCDENVNGDLDFNEFGLSLSECSTGITWGCKSAGYENEVSLSIEITSCNNLYLADPECINEGDDSERDSGFQIYGLDLPTFSGETLPIAFAPGDEGSWWSNLLDFIF